MRDSVVFYKSFYEAIKRLSNDTSKLEAYEAILEYALYGNVPGGLGEGAGIIFEMAKPQIDANQKDTLTAAWVERHWATKTHENNQNNHWLIRKTTIG